MTSNVVFDASALIALFAKEKGYEIVRSHLKNGIISTVNAAEVYRYCVEVQRLSETDCRSLIKISGVKIMDFTNDQALITAKIIKETRQYGLSLGDRSCIALALVQKAPILTCDRIWQKVYIEVEFLMAR